MISIYGIIISVAIASAVVVAEKVLKAQGRSADMVWDAVPYVVIGGIIGARAYHVLSLLSYYQQNPLLIFQIWNGGLGIVGAIVGGLLGLALAAKQYKYSFRFLLDLAATVLPLAQAIGRWGNFFNGELYGSKTQLPWGFNVNDSKVHPLFLYESLGLAAIFIVTVFVQSKKPKLYGTGIIFWAYIAAYSSFRFFLEFLRPNSWTVANVNIMQAVCTTAALTSSVILVHGIYSLRSRRI